MRASSKASKPHSYGESFSGSGRFGPSSFPSTIGATPTPMPTRMNSRIGKYSASIVWCPRADSNCYGFLGHQPLKLACLPISPRGRIRNYLPKLLRHRFFALRRRGFLRLGLRLRGFRFLLLAHPRAGDHAARLARLIRREICEREAGDEENRGEDRGGAREKGRRAGGAEEAAR